MQKPLFLLIFLVALVTEVLAAPTTGMKKPHEPTYCDDAAARHDWEQRITNNPQDRELQILHALWLGFCTKVKEHGFSSDRAMELFEDMRALFVEQRREDNADTEVKPER